MRLSKMPNCTDDSGNILLILPSELFYVLELFLLSSMGTLILLLAKCYIYYVIIGEKSCFSISAPPVLY